MRRSDREITDKDELIKIIDKYKVFRLAMQSERGVYILPLNYGYSYENKRLCLYFHSARSGRKIEILKENGSVCFEIDGAHELITDEAPCKYSSTYESIIGYGDVVFLQSYEEKSVALNFIMQHQAERQFRFPENAVEGTAVCRIDVSSFTGKRHMPYAYSENKL